MKRTLTIGTRGSALALWQAEHVRDRLAALHADLGIELKVISTRGDRILDRQLSEIGGKGLFIKEIEAEMFEGEIDLAVHSLKDMPWACPDGLELAVIPERASPWDVLCPREEGATLASLPSGARIGTGSLRRITQVRNLRPDIELVPIRGNVQTRLDKRLPEREDLDAVILAEAGLNRLGIEEPAFVTLRAPGFLPAPGQGALALQIRSDDAATRALIAALEDRETRLCVEAERAALHGIGGDCHTPFAAHARLEGDELVLSARLLDEDGRATSGAERVSLADGDALALSHGLGGLLAAELMERHGTAAQG